MKVMIAGLATETNTFSPIPTGMHAFQEGFFDRESTKRAPGFFSAPLHEWNRLAQERGWEVIESLCTFAQPGGVTTRSTYETLRDEILDDLKRAAPDILLLSLHGAMIAEGYEDCEGDILKKARDILGESGVIGVEIDLHTHLTDDMMQAADIIVAFKEYPHIDTAERAVEVFELAAATAEGSIKPVMRDFDCQMVAMYQTPREPMKSFVADMQAREGQHTILSLSLIHGFPWGDCARVGTRMLAISDGDVEAADQTAAEFGQRLQSLRDYFKADWPDIPEALNYASRSEKFPVVLADFADNAGAGAPADSTFVLKEVLRLGLKDVGIAIFWDPGAVMMAREAGIGALLRVRLGGKVDVASGQPIDITVTVRNIQEYMTQPLGAANIKMGTGVWLEMDGVHMIVSDHRTQAFHPDCFEKLGLDIDTLKIVVVKSSQHFYAGFAPRASEVVYIKGAGAVTPNYASIPYKLKSTAYWPRDDIGFET